jgi:hypothetical protein
MSRSRALPALLLVLSLAGPASAGEIGPQLGFPVPAAEIGNHQLGINAGVTANLFDQPVVGMGLDVAYHYWPVSSEHKATFERGFSGLLEIGAPDWNISAIQTTAHLKIVPPVSGAFRPWWQLGAGMYGMNPLLDFMGVKLKSQWQPGAFTSIGFDFEASPRMRVGLDVSYHRVWVKDKFGSDFHAFEVGTHLLIGRR